MNMNQVRSLARDRGVNPGKLTKPTLIKTLQQKEGNFDCFGSANGYCDQLGCLWREDCLGSNKNNHS